MLRLFRTLVVVGLLSLLLGSRLGSLPPSTLAHVAVAASACPAPVFGAASNFPVNSTPRGVAVGRFQP
jgi:hypothetical protein